jgi:hypothetical protein
LSGMREIVAEESRAKYTVSPWQIVNGS